MDFRLRFHDFRSASFLVRSSFLVLVLRLLLVNPFALKKKLHSERWIEREFNEEKKMHRFHSYWISASELLCVCVCAVKWTSHVHVGGQQSRWCKQWWLVIQMSLKVGLFIMVRCKGVVHFGFGGCTIKYRRPPSYDPLEWRRFADTTILILTVKSCHWQEIDVFFWISGLITVIHTCPKIAQLPYLEYLYCVRF